ncbi:MAG: hypothetical protein WAX79_08560, partial [Candidatus Omnitrophota bacterium]
MNTSPVGSFLENFSNSFMMMYQFGKQQELANKRLAAEERTAKMQEASFGLDFARATKAPPDITPYNQTGLLPQQGDVTPAGTTGLLGSVNAPAIGQSAEFDLPRPQIKGDPAFYATLQTKLDETKQVMQSAQAGLKAKQAQFIKETDISVNLMKDNIGNVNAGAIDLKKMGLSEETQAVVSAVWRMDEKNQAKIAKGMQTVFDIIKNPSATKEDVYTRIAQFSGYPDIYNILTTRADKFYAEAKELRTGVLFGNTLDGVMGHLNMFREGTAKNLPDDQITAAKNLSSNLTALGRASPSLAEGLLKIIAEHDRKMEPKKYEENTKEVHLGGGKFQERQFNPETGRYDIDVGLPYTQAQKAKPTERVAKAFLLKDGEQVLSYDGGQTYMGKDEKAYKMPYNALPITTTAGLEEMRGEKARQQAKAELEGTPTPITKSREQAALEGTGPYRKLAAAIDNVIGGMGGDLVFGARGIFPDTQVNRQVLRVIKQTGKVALMNSSRGAIWEQQRIDELFPDPDKTFRNPRSEARKFQTLRETLAIEKAYNNQGIIDAISNKQREKLIDANNEIDRLLGLIGGGGEKQG